MRERLGCLEIIDFIFLTLSDFGISSSPKSQQNLPDAAFTISKTIRSKKILFLNSLTTTLIFGYFALKSLIISFVLSVHASFPITISVSLGLIIFANFSKFLERKSARFWVGI